MPKIKTINDFINAAHTALAAAFPECRVETVNATKNNNVHLTGLTVYPQNKKVAPTIYLEPYFDALQSGQPFATVINQIINSCMNALSCSENDIDVGNITDFEQMKQKICYKLVNTGMNSELLSTVPHRDYLDLAIVYYIPFSLTDNGLATITVTDGLTHIWGTNEETLYNLACSNTPRLNRGIVLTLSDTLSGCTNTPQVRNIQVYDGYDFSTGPADILPMYIATNTTKTYGAAVILNDGLLKDVAEYICSSGVYAIPSSVHEFICIPDTFGNVEYIKQMVRDINSSEVQPDEVLSDNIYHYDVTIRELKVIS